MPASFLRALWEKLTNFLKDYKKVIKHGESKNLAAIVIIILKIS